MTFCLVFTEELLREHRDMPGIIVSQPQKEATVTSRGKQINLEAEIGMSLSIPRDSLVKVAHLGISMHKLFWTV